MRKCLLSLSLVVTLGCLSCGDPNPLFCETAADCRNPSLPFCDLRGEFPDSNGVTNTCTAEPLFLSVSIDGTGTVTSFPTGIDCPQDCQKAFSDGMEVTLSATAQGTAIFAGWSGDCSGLGDCTVTVDAPRTVGARFAPERTLQVVLAGNGTGTISSAPAGIDCGATCSANFAEGTTVTLSAVADANGSVFLGWGGPTCSGMASCDVILGQDMLATAMFGLPGQNLWLNQIGDSLIDRVENLVLDQNGDVVIVGSFNGAVSVGGINLTSNGRTDMFVAKLSASDGTAIWARNFGGAFHDYGRAVAVAVNGDVVLGGEFASTVNFGQGNVSAGNLNNIVLLRLASATGVLSWVTTFGGTAAETIEGLDVDGSGNIAVTGIFDTNVSLGGASFSSQGTDDFYVGKFSGNDGSHIWSRAAGGPEIDVSSDVAVDNAGNVVITGAFRNTVDFGGGGLSSNGSSDIFVAKYASADGSHLFSRRFGGIGGDRGTDVDTDSSDNIVLFGDFAQSVDFGGGALVATGLDLVLLKISQAGAYQWALPFSSSGTNLAKDLLLTPSGDIAVTGSFAGTISFGGSPLSSAGGTNGDVFVATFDGAGNSQSSFRVGGTGNEVPSGVAIGGVGEVYLGGLFTGFAEFGGAPLTSAGGTDGFVMAIVP